MRSLLVAQTFPWPPTGGGSIRVLHTLRALADLGPVDLVALHHPAREEPCVVPPDAPVERTFVRQAPPLAVRGPARLGWLLWGGEPLEMAGGRFAAAAAEVAAWARPAYDLVWCWRPHSVWVAPPVGPIVLDHDDLEDGKIRARLAALAATPRSLGRRLRDAAAGVQARADARRWRTVQRRVASGVAAVSVCSETDRVRLELASAVVIPNGYQLEGEPVGGAPALHDPPTLLFQGSLVRPPNADAVSVLLREVMPLVWERRPEVRVLLAGRADDTIRRQAADPRVEVTGWVRDMTGQLARADAVVTPIRYGGGTRLKILEAFAHRLPVVSTPAGAEGLDAEDGRHLLLADQSARFAEAVLRLLADEPLRVRLAEEAFALYEARYRWDAIRRRMRGLARTVAGRTPEVKVR